MATWCFPLIDSKHRLMESHMQHLWREFTKNCLTCDSPSNNSPESILKEHTQCQEQRVYNMLSHRAVVPGHLFQLYLIG